MLILATLSLLACEAILLPTETQPAEARNSTTACIRPPEKGLVLGDWVSVCVCACVYAHACFQRSLAGLVGQPAFSCWLTCFLTESSPRNTQCDPACASSASTFDASSEELLAHGAMPAMPAAIS